MSPDHNSYLRAGSSERGGSASSRHMLFQEGALTRRKEP